MAQNMTWSEAFQSADLSRPALFRDTPGALVSESELFRIAVRAGEAWRSESMSRPHDLRIFVDDNVLTSGNLDRYLPYGDDVDLAGYIARVTSCIGAPSWSLVLNNVQQYSWAVYLAARSCLYEYVRSLPVPPAGLSDCFLVLGSYKRGPTAIHKDGANVVLMPVTGTKTMRTWEYGSLLPWARPNAREDAYMPLSIEAESEPKPFAVFTAEPGQAIYWPYPYWHCAESDGGAHLSLHLATYHRDNFVQRSSSIIEGVLGERWAESERQRTEPALSAQDAAEWIGQTLGTISTQMPERLEAQDLARRSAVNFGWVPPLGGKDHEGDDRTLPVWIDRRFPVLTSASADIAGRLKIAVNGHVIKVTDAIWVRDLIESVNSTSPDRPTTELELVALVGGTSSKFARAATDLVDFLRSARAFDEAGL